MARFAAFLRAINLGGKRTVKMDSLRRIFESLGFSEVETFIASGNVIFTTRHRSGQKLERKIEQRLREALGHEVAVFVRTKRELIEIANHKPSSKSKMDARVSCNVLLLAEPLDEKTAKTLNALKTSTDEFHLRRREIYWLRRKRPDASFSTVPLERILRRPFTIRACNTIDRMASKY